MKIRLAALCLTVLALVGCSPTPTQNSSPAAPSETSTSPAPPSSEPASSATAGTQTILINPFNADGSVSDAYSVEAGEVGPVDCSSGEPSPFALSPNTHSCGSTSDSAYACWANPGEASSLLCLYSPTGTQLASVKATGMRSTPKADDPVPMGIELADGSRWWLYWGGGYASPDGTSVKYVCYEGCSAPTLALVQADDEPLMDKTAATWTILKSDTASDPSTLADPTRAEITKVWYLGDPADAGAA